MLPIAFFLLPFVQLGLSFYASFATLLAVVIALRFHMVFRIPTDPFVAVTIIIAAAMFLSLLSQTPMDLGQSALRIAREALFFTLLAIAVPNIAKNPPLIPRAALPYLIAIPAFFLLLMVIIQFLALARGIYLGPPKAAMAQNANTVPDLLTLRYTKVRPAGFYGEPSYLAFMATTLMVMIAPVALKSRLATWTLIAVVTTGLLSQSLSFVIAGSIVAYFAFFQGQSARLRITFVLLTISGAGLALALGALKTRFGGGTGVDISTYVRMLAPLLVLGQSLIDNPFGTSFLELERAISSQAASLGLRPRELLHNGLYNIIFSYGLIAVPIVWLTFRAVSDNVLRIYVLAAMMFNGAFFQIDKITIVLFTLIIYHSLMYSPEMPVRISRRRNLVIYRKDLGR